MNLLNKYKYVIVALIVGILGGRYLTKPKTVTEVKEVIKYVEKRVEVEVSKKKTKTTITESKDGSKVTVIDEVEDKTKNTDITIASKKETDKTVTIGHGLTLGVIAIKNFKEFSHTDVGVMAAVPLFGNVKVIGFGATSPSTVQIGAGLGMEF